VFELSRIAENRWIITNEFARKIAENAKIFSPANLRSSQDLPGYAAVIDEWMTKRLTLRYTGGMVPDVASILIKGNGIFASPVSSKAPAKLRLVFECAPIAYIVEAAGGRALSGRNTSECVLDVVIESMDDRVGIVCGSKREVEKTVESIVENQGERVMRSGA
jgi:sedoheptulose-bisphosphatase